MAREQPYGRFLTSRGYGQAQSSNSQCYESISEEEEENRGNKGNNVAGKQKGGSSNELVATAYSPANMKQRSSQEVSFKAHFLPSQLRTTNATITQARELLKEASNEKDLGHSPSNSMNSQQASRGSVQKGDNNQPNDVSTNSKGRLGFHFANMWMKEEGFEEIVKEAWNNHANRQLAVTERLKRFEYCFKNLDKNVFGSVRLQFKEELATLQVSDPTEQQIQRKNFV